MRPAVLWPAALWLAACSHTQPPPGDADAGVAFSGPVITVAEQPVPETRQAVGTVRAVHVATLSSRLLAQVRTVSKQVGDRVRGGEALLVLDSRKLEARRDQSQAVRREAVHALAETERSLEAARASESAAQEQARLAQVTFGRFQRLLEKKSVSRQEFDEADTRLQAALAEQRRAARMAEAIEARLAGIRAKIQQADSEIRAAAAAFEDATIVSPFAGTLVVRHVEPGDMATPGSPLLTIEGNPHRVEADVPESWGAALESGLEAGVEIDALGESWNLAVTSVDPNADPQSRSFAVKVNLPPKRGLRSGLFARLSLQTHVRPAILLPASCVVEKGQLTGVYVADSENSARLRLVRTGQRRGQAIEILSGLSVGERVVAVPRDSILSGE